MWIEYFRQRGPVSSALRNLIKQGRVAVAGPVIYELRQAVKSRKDADLIKEATKALPLLIVTQETWLAAGDLLFDLRRKGITRPPSDVLLAALAIQTDCPVFTQDTHVDHIPKIRRFPLP